MSLIAFETYGVTDGTQELVHWSLTSCVLSAEVAPSVLVADCLFDDSHQMVGW